MNPNYVRRVIGLPLLDSAQESTLARRWQDSGDWVARNELVEAHLRLVLPIARAYFRPGASLSELVAEGNVGLLRAADKFEPERGFRFSTYARHWIRALVSECAIRASGPGLSQPRTLRKVRREHARAMSLVGDDDRQARRLVAERLHLGAATVDELVDLLPQRRVSIETLGFEWRGADGPLCAPEASPEQALLNRAAEQSMRETVLAVVTTLNLREQRIVKRRLMADRDAMLTLKELGVEFGVSRERVRQLEVNVKRKLASQLCSRSNAVVEDAPLVAA